MNTSTEKITITRLPYFTEKDKAWYVQAGDRKFWVGATRVYNNRRPGRGGSTYKVVYHDIHIVEYRDAAAGGNQTVASFAAYTEPRAKAIQAIAKFLNQ